MKENIPQPTSSGIGIIRFTNHIAIPPGGTYKFEPNIGEALKKDDLFQAWRGHIINNALFIEEKIDLIISKLLFRKELEGAGLFKSVVLSREFFSFMSKWKVMRDLLKTLSPFKEANYSELFRDLQFIVNERDKFAHGQVMYSGNSGERILLEYFKETLQKEEITEATVKTFIEKCTKCYEKLDKIIIEAQRRQDVN
jgi:hypothetical protein